MVVSTVTGQDSARTDPGNIGDSSWWRGFPKWWWYLVVVPATVIAFLAILYYARYVPFCDEWVQGLAFGEALKRVQWPRVADIYGVAIVLSFVIAQALLFVFDLLTTLETRTASDRRDPTKFKDKTRNLPNGFPAAFVSVSETLMYVTAFSLGFREFVAAWLVLKVAGTWTTWTTGHDGRRTFNRFLFGNAISISASFLGYIGLRMFATRC